MKATDKTRLVESFIKKYGDEYIEADDKWVLVDDYLAEQNYQSEDLTDDIDDEVRRILGETPNHRGDRQVKNQQEEKKYRVCLVLFRVDLGLDAKTQESNISPAQWAEAEIPVSRSDREQQRIVWKAVHDKLAAEFGSHEQWKAWNEKHGDYEILIDDVVFANGSKPYHSSYRPAVNLHVQALRGPADAWWRIYTDQLPYGGEKLAEQLDLSSKEAKELMGQNQAVCDVCWGDLEYCPAEYETLSGRGTVEQYPATYICVHCGSNKAGD